MRDTNIEEWFKSYEPKYVEEVNVYPNITTFNFKSCTLLDPQKVKYTSNLNLTTLTSSLMMNYAIWILIHVFGE